MSRAKDAYMDALLARVVGGEAKDFSAEILARLHGAEVAAGTEVEVRRESDPGRQGRRARLQVLLALSALLLSVGLAWWWPREVEPLPPAKNSQGFPLVRSVAELDRIRAGQNMLRIDGQSFPLGELGRLGRLRGLRRVILEQPDLGGDRGSCLAQLPAGLVSLELQGAKGLVRCDWRHLEHLQGLVDLLISQRVGPGSNPRLVIVPRLTHSLKRLPRLRRLELSRRPAVAGAALPLAEDTGGSLRILGELTRLETLDLSGQDRLQDGDLLLLVRGMPGLRELYLTDCWGLTDEGLSRALRVLSPRLRGMDLGGVLQLGPVSFAELGECKQLRQLRVCVGPAAGDDELRQLTGLTSLKSLALVDHFVGDIANTRGRLHVHVSEVALQSLRAALPACKVEYQQAEIDAKVHRQRVEKNR